MMITDEVTKQSVRTVRHKHRPATKAAVYLYFKNAAFLRFFRVYLYYN